MAAVDTSFSTTISETELLFLSKAKFFTTLVELDFVFLAQQEVEVA